jgi:hypothetical protein
MCEMTAPAPLAFTELLDRAITEPGRVHEAYRAFHSYSVGNQLLALFECAARGIEPGPLATFPGWKTKGRYVRKGEKAITLCMPITCKRTADTDDDPDAPQTFTRFIYRPRWFVLAQTDGADVPPSEPPSWNRHDALSRLQIEPIPFTHTDGNCQGFARGRGVAVSPLAAFPFKTLIHECAHVLLGHTAEHEQADGELTPRSLREVEAEGVAMLVCAALQLPGIEYSRGYIQAWNRDGQPIPERSAARIFKTADQILRAGRPDHAAVDGEDN